MIDAGIDVSHAVHPDSVHHLPYDTSQCGELSYITISVNLLTSLYASAPVLMRCRTIQLMV